MRNRWARHLLVLLIYCLLAVALTWPLVAHGATHVPGNGADDPPLTWNLWWVRSALLDLAANPFQSDRIFFPIGINLAFYTLTLWNGLLSIPLQAAFGLVPASNLLLLSSFVLGGYGAFLLAEHLLATLDPRRRSHLLPALAAGVVYAFCSSKLFYAALGQWNIASSQWIPFYVLTLIRMGERPRSPRLPLIAALFLLFQAYAELTYASFLILFTALWAAWRLAQIVRNRALVAPGRAAAELGLGLALLGCVFLLGLLPTLTEMLPDLRSEGDIWAEGGGFAGAFSADLAGFWVPTLLHPLFGRLVGRLDFEHAVGQHLYFGYTLLALAVTGAAVWWNAGANSQVRARPAALRPAVHPPTRSGGIVHFWSLSALVFWLLTLGPSLRINGHDTGLPLPFAVVSRLPFFEGNRYPSRYSVLLFLSLAILLAFGLTALEHRLGRARGARRLLPALLVLLALFEHLSAPLPLSDMRIPDVYDHLSQQPGQATLLDLPIGWRNGARVTGTQHPIIMFVQYYQTAHGRPLLSGNTSRNPRQKFQYFAEAPVVNTLIALETGHPVDAAVVARDRALAPDVLRFFGVQDVVVHLDHAGQLLVPYLEEALPLARTFQDEDTLGYRVQPAPAPSSWTVSPGDDLARLSLAEGWGPPGGGLVWAQRRSVRLLVPLRSAAAEVTWHTYVPETDQELTVEIGGEAEKAPLSAGWNECRLTLPGSAVVDGLNQVRLRFGTLAPAGRAVLLPRSIGSTGIPAPVNLVVQSAGLEVGDFGLIYANGKQVSPNQRGYNIAVLDPLSGAVEHTASFDTHLDGNASHALAQFLTSVPAGRLVALAAADDASRLLSEEAVAALASIGAQGDLRDRFRWGHAVVGIKGAAPGSALEALDWMRPVTLVVGDGVTEPEVAAAFGQMVFRSLAADLTPAPQGLIIGCTLDTTQESTND